MGRRLPPEGEVRFITITDKQFEHIRIFWGKQRMPSAKTPDQLTFF
jgi:CRISPR-associated protein Cas2